MNIPTSITFNGVDTIPSTSTFDILESITVSSVVPSFGPREVEHALQSKVPRSTLFLNHVRVYCKSKDAEQKRKIHAARGDITSSDEDDDETGGKMFSSKFKSKLYLCSLQGNRRNGYTARRSVVKRHPLMAIKRKVKLEISSDSESDDKHRDSSGPRKRLKSTLHLLRLQKHWLGKARKRLNAGVKKSGIKLGVLFKNQHPDRNIKRGRRRR